MSGLVTLRKLLADPSPSVSSGEVISVSGSTAYVLSGSRVIPCSYSIPLTAGDKVRVQGLLVLSRIDKVKSDVPVYIV